MGSAEQSSTGTSSSPRSVRQGVIKIIRWIIPDTFFAQQTVEPQADQVGLPGNMSRSSPKKEPRQTRTTSEPTTTTLNRPSRKIKWPTFVSYTKSSRCQVASFTFGSSYGGAEHCWEGEIVVAAVHNDDGRRGEDVAEGPEEDEAGDSDHDREAGREPADPRVHVQGGPDSPPMVYATC